MGVTQAQCNRRERATAYVHGELDARGRVAFQRHLRVCTLCAQDVELLRGVAHPVAPRSAAPRRRLFHRPVPGPAIVGFLAVAIVGIVTVALSHRAASIRYERAEAGWTAGGAAIKLEGNQLELLVVGMPRPPRGKAYQVWVMERGTRKLVPTSAMLSPGRAGDAGVDVPGDYHDWYAVAVYVETLHHTASTRSGAVVVADLRNVS
jgi:hypothetical protein